MLETPEAGFHRSTIAGAGIPVFGFLIGPSDMGFKDSGSVGE